MKNGKTRILCLLVAVAMLIAAVPLVVFAEGIELANSAQDTTVDLPEGKAAIAGVGYETLADAIADAKDGDVITLLDDITAEAMFIIKRDIVIDGAGHSITSSAKKTFEVYASATFKNVTVNNTYTSSGGRAIDTRVGGITLTLDGATLNANTKGYNQQVLNIGGNAATEDGVASITLVVKNSFINASNSGYGIMTFNPVNATVEGSKIYGYAALYFKPADGSVGSVGSEVKVIGSTLGGAYHENEDFGTVVFEDEGITFTLDESSAINASGAYAVLMSDFNLETVASANTVILNGKVNATNIIANCGEDTVLIATNPDVAAQLNGEGVKVENVAAIITSANGEIAIYETLADALAAAVDGDNILLTADASVKEILYVKANVTIDGAGHSVTSSAKKTFEVHSSVTFKDITINNTYSDKTGRCINTRVGGITLTLEGVTLNANTNGANQQGINIGGNAATEDGIAPITLVIKDSSVNVSTNGYGIIVYNPINATITDSEISGYAAFYFKSADGSVGSVGSEVKVIGSTLGGAYHENEDFGTVVFEDEGITFTLDESSAINASGAYAVYMSDFGNEDFANANTVVLNGEVNAAQIIGNHGMNTVVIATNPDVAAQLNGEGVKVENVAAIITSANGEIAIYETLADALAAAVDGDTILLTADASVKEILYVNANVTIDGAGHSVTSSAKKTFEVYASATFKNVTVNNTYTSSGGRAIDTRVGGITLTLDGATLNANTKGYNQQVLNIGGNAATEDGVAPITLVVKNSFINASNSGYGIMTFNPVNATVEGSEIYGYAALYFKPADGSVGSVGSEVKVIGSTLGGAYHENEDFGAVVFEDEGITFTLDESSAINAAGAYAVYMSGFGNEDFANANTVVLNGEVNAAQIIGNYGMDTVLIATNPDVAAQLAEGGIEIDDNGTASGLCEGYVYAYGENSVKVVKNDFFRFLGTSLKATSTAEKTKLRFSYEILEGAEIEWTWKFGWDASCKYSFAGTPVIGESTNRTNLVLTDIAAKNYDKTVYVMLVVTVNIDGEEYTVYDEIKQISVIEEAQATVADGDSTAAEIKYAEDVIAAYNAL